MQTQIEKNADIWTADTGNCRIIPSFSQQLGLFRGPAKGTLTRASQKVVALLCPRVEATVIRGLLQMSALEARGALSEANVRCPRSRDALLHSAPHPGPCSKSSSTHYVACNKYLDCHDPGN